MSTSSVVIATYNGSKYIKEQLDTIYKQTRTPNEVIIGDDCSKDDTVDIVKKYIEDKGLIRFWKQTVNDHNKGYAKNFIDLSLQASGDIIFFCDQDDIWNLEKIEKMMTIMENDPSIDLLCSNLEPFYDGYGGRKWDQKDLDAMTNDGNIEKPVFSYENFFCQRSGCTMCVRRYFLHAIAPYWCSNWAHDDFMWKLAVLKGSCAIFQYCSLKRRMHENNASSIHVRTREWRINQIEDQRGQCAACDRFIKENSLENKAKEIVADNITCLDLRKKLLKNRNPFIWIKLMTKYKQCFVRRKALFLDLYLTLFRTYKGVN